MQKKKKNLVHLDERFINRQAYSLELKTIKISWLIIIFLSGTLSKFVDRLSDNAKEEYRALRNDSCLVVSLFLQVASDGADPATCVMVTAVTM